jgi:3-methyladenine DNA glycosylase AlkC
MQPLKDQLYSRHEIKRVAQAVAQAKTDFDEAAFTRRVHARGWKGLELKQRMRRVTTALHEALQLPYPEAADVMGRAASLGQGFVFISCSDYIEVYGQYDLDVSIPALRETTKGCSAEFAVRPFIAAHPDVMFKTMQRWAKDQDERIRRLASEGSRPRLPWGMGLAFLKVDPSPIVPILKLLKNDPSETVRRSVANNLNDISKDNPEVALRLAEAWYGSTPETDKLVRHGLRTLLKQGHPDALRVTGCDSEGATVRNLVLASNEVTMGQNLEFSFDLHVPEAITVRLDHAIYYLRKRGQYSRKVFRISAGPCHGTQHITRRRSFRDMSTRRHYPGEHFLSIIVNGRETRKKRFTLKE